MKRASENKAVALTMRLPGIRPRPGRRPTGKALSGAERQRRFRERHKFVNTGERIGATIKRLSEQFDIDELTITRELLRFALCNRNWSQTGFPSVADKVEK